MSQYSLQYPMFVNFFFESTFVAQKGELPLEVLLQPLYSLPSCMKGNMHFWVVPQLPHWLNLLLALHTTYFPRYSNISNYNTFLKWSFNNLLMHSLQELYKLLTYHNLFYSIHCIWPSYLLHNFPLNQLLWHTRSRMYNPLLYIHYIFYHHM